MFRFNNACIVKKKNSADNILKYFIFPKGNNLHEVSNPIFLEK